jgi:hypothetical protein
MLAHVRSSWRSWLSALATDAEAAIAAALTYETLSGEVRDAWLDAIAIEAASLNVPVVAFYAPLLAVELDSERVARMQAAVAADRSSARPVEPEPIAWMGTAEGGLHACVVAAPLHLDYFRVLQCRYTPDDGFVSATCDPLRHASQISSFCEVDGVSVEPTPLPIVVDELSHAILADRRRHRAPPTALESFVHLFAPEAKWTTVGPTLACDSQVG